MESSTPRVARYSARTEWRRWPLGSMFLEGMGGGLSELGVRGAKSDEAGGEDHGESSPLDGVEESFEGVLGGGDGLAEEGDEELGDAGGGEGQGDDGSGVVGAG